MAGAKVKFPFQAFIVTASMNIREVTVVGYYDSYFSKPSYYKLKSGGMPHVSQVHKEKADAIAEAKVTLASQEKRLQRAQELFNKRKAALAKAEKE